MSLMTTVLRVPTGIEFFLLEFMLTDEIGTCVSWEKIEAMPMMRQLDYGGGIAPLLRPKHGLGYEVLRTALGVRHEPYFACREV